jgi:hypothetical protein
VNVGNIGNVGWPIYVREVTMNWELVGVTGVGGDVFQLFP